MEMENGKCNWQRPQPGNNNDTSRRQRQQAEAPTEAAAKSTFLRLSTLHVPLEWMPGRTYLNYALIPCTYSKSGEVVAYKKSRNCIENFFELMKCIKAEYMPIEKKHKLSKSLPQLTLIL